MSQNPETEAAGRVRGEAVSSPLPESDVGIGVQPLPGYRPEADPFLIDEIRTDRLGDIEGLVEAMLQ